MRSESFSVVFFRGTVCCDSWGMNGPIYVAIIKNFWYCFVFLGSSISPMAMTASIEHKCKEFSCQIQTPMPAEMPTVPVQFLSILYMYYWKTYWLRLRLNGCLRNLYLPKRLLKVMSLFDSLFRAIDQNLEHNFCP